MYKAAKVSDNSSDTSCKGSNADNTIRACLYIQGGTDEEENSRRAMKRGYIARRPAPRPVRKLRSFGASRAKPETNIGFNPLQ